MTRISCTALALLVLCSIGACSDDKVKRVSLNDLLQNKKQLIGSRVLVDGCIFWGRHGAGILPCDGGDDGMGILDPDGKLLEAFGSVGALPYGGEIRAEIRGTVVFDDAYQPTEVDSPSTRSRTYLRVERVLKAQKAGS